ncbi:MAG: hypothetical protein E2O60_02355 [Gammaproteobacteria bacterium]|nr:MAG: hypothetical protein E2O60_02355 [Gammaproteobacteria bacterium]
MEDTDHYRCRLIYLRQSADLSKQAEAACEKLAGIEGILLATPADQYSIRLIYSLDYLSFEMVVDLLDELGFEMNDSILLTLKNTIYQFLDTNARENMHIDVTQFEDKSVNQPDTPEIPHRSSEKYWEDYH